MSSRGELSSPLLHRQAQNDEQAANVPLFPEMSGAPSRESALLGLAAMVVLMLLDWYVRDSPMPQNDEAIYEFMAQ